MFENRQTEYKFSIKWNNAHIKSSLVCTRCDGFTRIWMQPLFNDRCKHCLFSSYKPWSVTTNNARQLFVPGNKTQAYPIVESYLPKALQKRVQHKPCDEKIEREEQESVTLFRNQYSKRITSQRSITESLKSKDHDKAGESYTLVLARGSRAAPPRLCGPTLFCLELSCTQLQDGVPCKVLYHIQI